MLASEITRRLYENKEVRDPIVSFSELLLPDKEQK